MIEINSFDPKTLILIALFNPAVIAVAFLMGRRADQPQKLILAAFAAAAAGFLLYYGAVLIGLIRVHALGGEAAMVGLQFGFGLVWACIGYYLFAQRRT